MKLVSWFSHMFVWNDQGKLQNLGVESDNSQICQNQGISK